MSDVNAALRAVHTAYIRVSTVVELIEINDAVHTAPGSVRSDVNGPLHLQ